jgi:hypothetical protein
VNGDEVAKIVDAAIRAHDAAHAGPWGIGWEAWAIVMAILLGPVAAIVVSLLMTWQHDDKRQMLERRMRVFRQLLATRASAAHYDHVSALNLVEIDFYQVVPVIDAWRVYMRHLASVPPGRRLPPEEDKIFGDKRTDLLAALLKQIAVFLKFEMGEIDLKRGGYSPQVWADQENRDAAMKEAITILASGQRPLRVQPEAPPTHQP